MKNPKFNVGDKVGHCECLSAEFEVIDILPSVPEKTGKYLYECRLISNKDHCEMPQGWATAIEVARDINYPTETYIGKRAKYDQSILFLIVD